MCLLPILNHCLVTQGWNKELTPQKATRTTVLLFLKLKVRSISTSQRNGPRNRWLRIILAYTSPSWIKMSLLCVVHWGQQSLGRMGLWAPPIFSHSLEPSTLWWEHGSSHSSQGSTEHSWGAVNSSGSANWFFLKAKIPAFLPVLIILHSLPNVKLASVPQCPSLSSALLCLLVTDFFPILPRSNPSIFAFLGKIGETPVFERLTLNSMFQYWALSFQGLATNPIAKNVPSMTFFFLFFYIYLNKHTCLSKGIAIILSNLKKHSLRAYTGSLHHPLLPNSNHLFSWDCNPLYPNLLCSDPHKAVAPYSPSCWVFPVAPYSPCCVSPHRLLGHLMDIFKTLLVRTHCPAWHWPPPCPFPTEVSFVPLTEQCQCARTCVYMCVNSVHP